MASIIINPRVEMSDLELRARQGDTFAQEMLESQCMHAVRIHRSPKERIKRASEFRRAIKPIQ